MTDAKVKPKLTNITRNKTQTHTHKNKKTHTHIKRTSGGEQNTSKYLKTERKNFFNPKIKFDWDFSNLFKTHETVTFSKQNSLPEKRKRERRKTLCSTQSKKNHLKSSKSTKNDLENQKRVKLKRILRNKNLSMDSLNC